MNNVEGRRTESQPRGPEVLLGEVLALLNAIRAQSPRSLFLANFRLADHPGVATALMVTPEFPRASNKASPDLCACAELIESPTMAYQEARYARIALQDSASAHASERPRGRRSTTA